MSVRFTNMHIYVQFIDDTKGITRAAASSRGKGQADLGSLAANVDGAAKMGKLAAETAQGKGIKAVLFDRRGALYHGKVKALAEAAREAGLQF